MADFVLSQTAEDVQKALNNALNPDTTLTESGKPADSKAVGDAIREVAESMGDDVEDRLTALEERLEEHINPYVNIAISGQTNGVTSVQEKGKVINSIIVSWNVNRTPKSLTISGPGIDGTLALDVTAKSYAIPNQNLGITFSNTNSFKWTIKAVGERGEANGDVSTKTTSAITFYNGVYYGVMEDGAAIDSAAILKLTRKLQSGIAIDFTATAGATQRIAFAAPSGYGTPKFTVGGFEGGFYKAGTFQFENSSKYIESYDVWLSDDLALNTISVSVTKGV